MTLKWWEKTVEYYFVKKCVQDRMVIAPLDGQEESAGDAIFSSNNRWVLIEFKKDLSSIDSEISKFRDFNLAKSELSTKDNHHYVIYGSVLQDKVEPEFEIIVRTYFSGKFRKNIDQIIGSGVGINEFINYIKAFTAFKKTATGSSGGGFSPEQYSLVAGISEENKIVECMNLSEFGLKCGLNHANSYSQSTTKSYPHP